MKPPAIIAFLVMTAVFFGGAISGLLLALTLSPQFPFAVWLGLCSLPLAFIIGAHLWLGLAMRERGSSPSRMESASGSTSSPMGRAATPGSLPRRARVSA